MPTRKLPLYAALLTIPTLIAGVVLGILLQREYKARAFMAEQQLAVAAKDLSRQITDFLEQQRGEVIGRFNQLPIKSDELENFRKDEPLVRNVFVYNLDHGLVYPDAREPFDEEERGFINRYVGLFLDDNAWQTEATPERRSKSLSPPPQAWQVWFWEDRFYLLGWQKDFTSENIKGFEVETMSLFAQMMPTLTNIGNGNLAIIDNRDRVFLNLGETSYSKDRDVLVRYPIGNPLPHWQVVGWYDRDPQGLGFIWIFTALAVLVLLCIALGGSALYQLARSQMMDAARKTSFVSNVSHELKTPLTTIRMYAELLGDGRVKDEDKRKSFLQVIIDESQRLTRLVNNVLELGRMERGGRQLDLSESDLSARLKGLAEMQRPRLERESIKLELEIPERSIHARINPDAFEQVVLNLLDNAVKYGCAGDRKQVSISLQMGAREHEIFIRDHGPGIPKDLREKVFEKFYRVDQSLTSDKAGSGIGLSIARLMMTAMNGKLTYQDMEDGACFRVTLPNSKQEEGS